MRISDWSSDVCSSDLGVDQRPGHAGGADDAHSRSGQIQEVAPRLAGVGWRGSGDICHASFSPTIPLSAPRRARSDRSDPGPCARETRSEEHTSELQSLMLISYAVFCLKKKNKHTNEHTIVQHTQYHRH